MRFWRQFLGGITFCFPQFWKPFPRKNVKGAKTKGEYVSTRMKIIWSVTWWLLYCVHCSCSSNLVRMLHWNFEVKLKKWLQSFNGAKIEFTMWHFKDRWICKCSARRATRMCQISVTTFKLIVKFSELGSSRSCWTIFVIFQELWISR